MKVASTLAELRAARPLLPNPVGLVPTMGALHEGHISLIRAARAENSAVLATIFVNPAQFGPDEDYSSYPRTLERDLEILAAEGVDLVFTPSAGEMYPPGFQTTVDVAHVSQGLEGDHRPGHFQGVATVLAKLFNLTQPAVAYFGQKDAQQVVVVRRLAADLNFPLEIAVIPTMREDDGLAMSSRNRHLTPELRPAATVVSRALSAAAQIYDAGERDPDSLRSVMTRAVLSEPMAVIDYISVADPQTLDELAEPTDEPVLASLAVRIGQTRLLDNALLPVTLNNRDGLARTLGAL